jgi:hypothetical protein
MGTAQVNTIRLVLDIGMGTVHSYYFMSGAFMLGWARPTTIILCLVPLCWNGHGPQLLLYVWCLYVGMGKAHSYYSMSGALMLGWARPTAIILCLVPLHWDGNSPRQIYV